MELSKFFPRFEFVLYLVLYSLQVFISHDSPRMVSALPENVTEVVGIKCLTRDGVQFKDGTSTACDVLMLCSGYRYEFPFLSDTCALNTKDEYVQPLYKQLVHAKFPSLFVIGVCKTLTPLPHFHCQVLFCLAVITEKIHLPSKQEMLGDVDQCLQLHLSLGKAVRHFHDLNTLQWAYNDDLADTAKFDRLPSYYRQIFDHSQTLRTNNLREYRNVNYKLFATTGDDKLQYTDFTVENCENQLEAS